jgi:hypothetical protein
MITLPNTTTLPSRWLHPIEDVVIESTNEFQDQALMTQTVVINRPQPAECPSPEFSASLQSMALGQDPSSVLNGDDNENWEL